MKVYYICEVCQEVFYEGKLGDEESVLTIDSLCPDCSEEMGMADEIKYTYHYYS
ncbi:MAG: hypothetical protein ACM3QZ_14005 [Solirubrobacterales bacterium]